MCTRLYAIFITQPPPFHRPVQRRTCQFTRTLDRSSVESSEIYRPVQRASPSWQRPRPSVCPPVRGQDPICKSDPSRYNFHGKLRSLFERNRSLSAPEDIERAFRLCDYIKRETLALYSLRKYRHLKRMYPPPPPPPTR
ncbi:unnamed protein product [Mycena citricolor]|uniref:Uncharacterized protein n=1 Tax=Mycena citricolor TaxID=2018698 RepID=A0AAD2H7G0_9AGAR|nr:unnamed protein product [Mycena citricolor]